MAHMMKPGPCCCTRLPSRLGRRKKLRYKTRKAQDSVGHKIHISHCITYKRT
ncbi:uncharacterized protein G2W53_013037 [Senna tora]|uniref:Uncharacterized protein n=1 Tax=Senna tora TaxID=362788 RepID=A0A834WSP2_9FABA|nr:uncharacterized protein G2W53_013037 [Senna tora]